MLRGVTPHSRLTAGEFDERRYGPMTRLELKVRGLHCSGCERSLESAVRRLDGVVSAKADRTAERLSVELLPGRADAPAIRRRVEEAGFEAPE